MLEVDLRNLQKKTRYIPNDVSAVHQKNFLASKRVRNEDLLKYFKMEPSSMCAERKLRWLSYVLRMRTDWQEWYEAGFH